MESNMGNEYKISTATLKDIINNVPPEKWDECIDEMKAAVKQISAVVSIFKLTAETLINSNGEGVDLSDIVQFPDEITWIDDGKGVNTVNFIDGDSGEKMGYVELNCGEGE